MSIRRREFMSAAGSVLAPAAFAQSTSAYPARPVRVLVGFPAGGGIDTMARLVAQGLSEELKQGFVIENKPGANTVIAADTVAKAAPDGYSLLCSSPSAMTISPLLQARMPYNAEKDLQPITCIGNFPLVLVVNAEVPARSVAELVDLSKKTQNGLMYASGSVGFQLSVELFKHMSGANLYHVPYKGSVQMLTALITGESSTGIVDMTSVVPYIKSGKLRALAVTSSKRSPLYPELPTIAELGLAGYEYGLWAALFAPAGTPTAIINRIQTSVAKFIETPAARERLNAIGVETSGNTPGELAEMLRAERARLAPIIKRAGITDG